MTQSKTVFMIVLALFLMLVLGIVAKGFFQNYYELIYELEKSQKALNQVIELNKNLAQSIEELNTRNEITLEALSRYVSRERQLTAQVDNIREEVEQEINTIRLEAEKEISRLTVKTNTSDAKMDKKIKKKEIENATQNKVSKVRINSLHAIYSTATGA